jgi:hypothetical protein
MPVISPFVGVAFFQAGGYVLWYQFQLQSSVAWQAPSPNILIQGDVPYLLLFSALVFKVPE